MPGDLCGIAWQAQQEAARAVAEREVMMLLETAREALMERGYRCVQFSRLAESLILVPSKREDLRALPQPDSHAWISPFSDVNVSVRKEVRG